MKDDRALKCMQDMRGTGKLDLLAMGGVGCSK